MNHDDQNREFAPPFVRMAYYHGQMLSAQDFRAEQSYFREKRRLLNRMVLGHGVAYGLEVGRGAVAGEPCPADGRDLLGLRTDIARLRHRYALLIETGCDAEAAELMAEQLQPLLDQLPDAEEAPRGVAVRAEEGADGIVVRKGYALDCRGNDLVVRDAVLVDPNTLLDADERRALPPTGLLLLSLCYDEQPLLPTRPMGADPCDDPGEVFFARVRETVRVKLRAVDPDAIDAIHADEPCGAGEGCECGCTPLAVLLYATRPDGTVIIEEIDNSVRRPLSLYQPTRIIDIGWAHGATYGWNQTPALLRADGDSEGLLIRFSRPVRSGTLVDGIVDLTLTTGGEGMAGSMRHIACSVGLLDDGRVLAIKQKSRERFNEGDRITLTVRTSQLFDRCGRPVLGANLGGMVPQMPKRQPVLPMPGSRRPALGMPPLDMMYRHFQPWATGAGGDFVSWIHIGDEHPAPDAADDE